MKAFRCAARVASASVVLGLIGLLAGCSLETTGSGDFSLSADDDESDNEDPQASDTADASGAAPRGDAADDDRDGDDDGDSSDSSDAGNGKDGGSSDGSSDGDSKCRAGDYQGRYTCKQPTIATPAWASNLGGNEITGSFTFRLEPASKADTFVLTDGSLHSADNTFFKLDASIAATFTCGRPLRGKLVDASYMIVFGAAQPFESPFDATYDEATSSFQDGTWVVKDANGNTQCNGTWSATHSPD